MTELRENTFYAVLQLETREIEVDSRPSDASGFAVRADAPIFARGSTDPSGVEFEQEPADAEEIVEEFREFLITSPLKNSEPTQAPGAYPPIPPRLPNGALGEWAPPSHFASRVLPWSRPAQGGTLSPDLPESKGSRFERDR